MTQNAFGNRSVQPSTELERIKRIPRRTWTAESAQELADRLLPFVKTVDGTMKLLPEQGQALYEIGTYGGGFLPLSVGSGKTLLSFLAPYVLRSRRVLLLVPAAIKQKTIREMKEHYLPHFKIPISKIRVESYELLGRAQSATLLDAYSPDTIVLDEAHRAKNPRAAVTRRLVRYLSANPQTRVVAMSGTITKRSLKDFAHICNWCLPAHSPMPRQWHVLEEWASALDEKVNPFNRFEPGALLDLAEPQDAIDAVNVFGVTDDLVVARRAFGRRLTETPCVVATTSSWSGCSIYVTGDAVDKFDPNVESAFSQLRTQKVLPDGQPVVDGLSLWRHTRELALGFYYRWNPWPPADWVEWRRRWASFVWDVLKHNRQGWDSELQVAQACSRGAIDATLWRAWKSIEPSFTPNVEPVWLCDDAINYAADWLDKHKGICWVEHRAFGDRLAELSGYPYFGQGGVDATGRSIETASGAVIASVSSNATGRNLQGIWSKNLIMSPPPGGLTWEQLIGRTHRQGQEADEVTCEVYIGCIEHKEAIDRAVSDSKYILDSTGQKYKLLFADITMPDESTLKRIPSTRFQK